jgi:hypothetical protein
MVEDLTSSENARTRFAFSLNRYLFTSARRPA